MTPLLLIVVAALAAAGAVFVARRVRGSHVQADRARVEDALKHLYHTSQRNEPMSVESLAGALAMPRDAAARLLQRMMDDGLIVPGHERIQLTSDGSVKALSVIRSHRLWERYLADETGVGSSDWHASAEKAEHRLSPDEVEALAKRLGQPLFDPHGDPIPTATGVLPALPGALLPAADPGQWYMVMHVEDEPAAVYQDILAAGIQPGARIRVEARTDRSVRLSLQGTTVELPLLTAGNITVVPSRPADVTTGGRTLNSLSAGRTARVVGIVEECRGLQRRRLLDLGLVPGTVIGAEFEGPAGDPVAYRIRGSLVALRRQQASHVLIEEVDRG